MRSTPLCLGVAAMLGVAFASCVSESERRDENPGPDASTDSDFDATQDAPPPVTGCDSVRAEWSEFVSTHRACKTSADCTVVGGAGHWMSWCVNCEPAIGTGSGDPIAISALSQAQAYLSKFAQCIASGQLTQCGWDSAPATNLRCEQDMCMADAAFCHTFDSGPPPYDAADGAFDATLVDGTTDGWD